MEPGKMGLRKWTPPKGLAPEGRWAVQWPIQRKWRTLAGSTWCEGRRGGRKSRRLDVTQIREDRGNEPGGVLILTWAQWKDSQRVRQSFQLSPTSELTGQLINTALPDNLWMGPGVHTFNKPPGHPDLSWCCPSEDHFQEGWEWASSFQVWGEHMKGLEFTLGPYP